MKIYTIEPISDERLAQVFDAMRVVEDVMLEAAADMKQPANASAPSKAQRACKT